MNELEEVGRTADVIRADLETTFVRGLATSAPADRKGLAVRVEEWERVGAHHVATRLREALRAADADAKDAPSRFLSAYTSLHAFERVLSLEVAKNAWAAHRLARGEEADDDAGGAEAPSPDASASASPLEDPKAAAKLSAELAKIVEDLVRTGLTSATQATRTRLDGAFKEAARTKLLRLGASLRYVSEEVGRFLADDGSFAARRYAFFLHRSWLLAKGIGFAIAEKDARLVASLTSGASGTPKPAGGPLEVVVLGVHKRVAKTICTFDFRMRVTKAPSPALSGKSLVFSLVFSRKADVPAEAYLHLPQPQRFAPKILRDKTTLAITDAAILPDDRGGGRLVLGPKSTVVPGKTFGGWTGHYGWDPDGAERRVRRHAPSPLDLAVEMQEEIVLEDWLLASEPDGGASIQTTGVTLALGLPAGDEGTALRARVEAGAKKRKKDKPLLYGTVHYEFGRLVLSPLSLLGDDGPEYLMLSDEKINLAALLGSLNL